MFTNNRLDFRQGQTMTERAHSSAISKGVPSFVTSGLEYNEGTGSISSGFFVNCGAFGRLGNENEEQSITPNYTGFLVIKSNWRGGVTSDSELIESATRIDSEAGDTSEELYFTLYELENGLIKRNDKGIIIGDYRHNQFIKTIGVDLSTGGFGFSVNGVSSPFVNVDLTGITQRVLTLSDLGLTDLDFPDVEDNDLFVDFVFSKMPLNSIFIFSGATGGNMVKNFPFGDSGFAMATKIEGVGTEIGNIVYTLNGLKPQTTRGNTWGQEVFKEQGNYVTRGYSPFDSNSKLFTYNVPNNSEYNFPVDFSGYDKFTILPSDTGFTEYGQSSTIEASSLSKNVFLTSVSSNFTQLARYIKITEDNVFIGERTSSGALTSGRLTGIGIIATQIGLFKNSESVAWGNTRKTKNIEEYKKLYNGEE